MRHALALAISIPLLAVLTSCAFAGSADAVLPSPERTGPPAGSHVADEAARAQARAWLDAAVLPPGAVRSTEDAGRSVAYMSYTGWPCTPIAELEAYWTVPGMTVAGATNWLRANPPADLLVTTPGTLTDDPNMGSASTGYSPADGSIQGVVYTVVRAGDGVAVRAEIGALDESATCEALPDGGTWGKPGQG